MTKVKNSDTTRELIKAANLQVGFDDIPSELAKSIVPVININPKNYTISNVVAINDIVNSGGSATVYTVPTNKDFYLTNASLSMIKDVTATSIGTTLTVTPETGLATTILKIIGLTLTVQEEAVQLNLTFPLKLKKGSVISLANSTATGNVSASASIVGFTVENNQ
jgi:hypothetical protein